MKIKEVVTDIKTMATIVTSLVVICSAVVAIEMRYISTEELQAAELRLAGTLEGVRKDIRVDMLEERYIRAVDRVAGVKGMLIKYPNDPDIKDAYDRAVQERDNVKIKIEELRKGK